MIIEPICGILTLQEWNALSDSSKVELGELLTGERYIHQPTEEWLGVVKILNCDECVIVDINTTERFIIPLYMAVQAFFAYRRETTFVFCRLEPIS